MKILNKVIFLLLILLISCGKTETSGQSSASTSNSSYSYLSLYPSSYADSIDYGSTVTFYAYGGDGDYRFYISSGYGSINSSTGVFTAAYTTGYTTILVEDGDGLTAEYSIYISEDGTSDSSDVCTSLGSSSTVKSYGTPEVAVNLDNYSQFDDYAMVGMGARLASGNAVGLYVKLSRIEDDGSLDEDDSYAYKNGDLGGTTKGEIYIELPDDYMMYGFGLATESNGNDLQYIKIYGVKYDSDGYVSDTIQCAVSSSGSSGCSSSLSVSSSYSSRYKEYVGSTSKILRALGFATNDTTVNSLWARSAQLYFGESYCD